jgi:mannobiose 2-epimerase
MRESMMKMREGIRNELYGNILPFWVRYSVDQVQGGFIGRMSNDLVVDPTAPKSLILNSRILWTFSRACRLKPDPVNHGLADRALAYLRKFFMDPVDSGAFWMVGPDGRVSDAKKKTYGQVFLIYGLSEYARAFNDERAAEEALGLFQLVDRRLREPDGGYIEARERDWSDAGDLRLSDKDMNEKYSMNTHLHAMEAFASLYACRKDRLLGQRLKESIELFLDRIVLPDGSGLGLFFDGSWRLKSDVRSYGHDIEASWLLCEAAEILGDRTLEDRVKRTALGLVESVLAGGLEPDGSLIYESGPDGPIDTDRHFWTEAEAVVGFLNAYRISGQDRFLDHSRKCWEYAEAHLVDRRRGDWYYRVSREGQPVEDQPKISEWKCPYHTSRMCFEAEGRLKDILGP